MTTPDTITWTRHGDTEVAEWRGMRATVREDREAKRTNDAYLVVEDQGCSGFWGSYPTIALAKDRAESLMRLHAERDDLREENRHAGNLLAVLHGDGGHYLADHGWGKACRDAADQFYGRIRKLSRLRERVEVLEHIREIAEGADIRWRDEITFNQLIARLAELDKESDDEDR